MFAEICYVISVTAAATTAADEVSGTLSILDARNVDRNHHESVSDPSAIGIAPGYPEFSG